MLSFIYRWIGLYLLIYSFWLSILEKPGAQANRALSMSRLDRADGPEAVERIVFVDVGAKRIIGSNFLARLET